MQKIIDLASLFQLGVSLNIAFSAYLYFFDYEIARLSGLISKIGILFSEEEKPELKLALANVFLRANHSKSLIVSSNFGNSYITIYVVLISAFISMIGLIIASLSGDNTCPEIFSLVPVIICAIPIIFAIYLANLGKKIRSEVSKYSSDVEKIRISAHHIILR